MGAYSTLQKKVPPGYRGCNQAGWEKETKIYHRCFGISIGCSCARAGQIPAPTNIPSSPSASRIAACFLAAISCPISASR